MDSEVKFAFAKGHEIDTIEEMDISHIKRDFEKFQSKYGSFLKETQAHVYIKKHKEKTRKIPLYFVRVRIDSSKGLISAKAQGYGLILAVHNALEKVEKICEKKKSMGRQKK